jgi:large subunit ribosomal protein L22
MATRIKEKALKVAANREKRPHAHARNIRIAPTKMRAVIDTVRGKSVNEAIAILESTPKSSTPVVLKLIKSATANAEHNMGIARIDLKIAAIFADPGATMKRAMPRARGRSNVIFKRSCHVTVILDMIGKSLKEGSLEEYNRPKRSAAKKAPVGAIKPKAAAKKSAAPKATAVKKPAANKVVDKKEEAN